MAKSFKEIGKKAEALIEQGKEADQKVQSCQARVASSSNRVATARRQLAAASETDEEGNPVGDVDQARAQLSMAENQLAASQRALSSARGDADRIRQQKNAHVQEIEHHNQVERSNLEKLRKLRSSAFGADSAALKEGIAQRLNEAEDARVALLRSMGIDATPDRVPVGGDGAVDSGWRGGGFAPLDTSGQIQRYQGGDAEGVSSNRAIATPVGGGLGTLGNAISEGYPQEESKENQPKGENPSSTNENSAQNTPLCSNIYGEEARSAMNLDRLVDEQMTRGSSGPATQWHGRPRTPNEVLADMHKAIRENWMNNFNADEWKHILSEKQYADKLELYRKGVAIVTNDQHAASLTVEDLEQLSRVQNHAFLSGCQLTNSEIAELYSVAGRQVGNYVTPKIEKKMDLLLRNRSFELLQKKEYSFENWKTLTPLERKDVMKNMLGEMNSVLGTKVDDNIRFFYEESGRRGGYVDSENCVMINEYFLAKKDSYQLMQTLIHEMRHAYQHHSVRHARNALVSSHTISMWEDNFKAGHYKSPQAGYTIEEYLSQPVEWDAKNFALQCNELLGIHPVHSGSWEKGG